MFTLGNNAHWLLQGAKASVTTSNGDIYSGLFSGALPDRSQPEYLLKMVQLVRYGDRAEASGARDPPREYIGVGDEHAMAFKIQDVHDFAVEGILSNSQDKRPNGSLTTSLFNILRC